MSHSELNWILRVLVLSFACARRLYVEGGCWILIINNNIHCDLIYRQNIVKGDINVWYAYYSCSSFTWGVTTQSDRKSKKSVLPHLPCQERICSLSCSHCISLSLSLSPSLLPASSSTRSGFRVCGWMPSCMALLYWTPLWFARQNGPNHERNECVEFYFRLKLLVGVGGGGVKGQVYQKCSQKDKMRLWEQRASDQTVQYGGFAEKQT